MATRFKGKRKTESMKIGKSGLSKLGKKPGVRNVMKEATEEAREERREVW